MLTELASIVREFTEPRHQSVPVETRDNRARLIRRIHRTTLPPLLTALRMAARPADLNTGHMSGSFVSQPAANLTAVSALRQITDECALWCQRLEVVAPTIEAQMGEQVSALSRRAGAGAVLQLELVLTAFRQWHLVARVACAEEDPPRTLNQQCPACFRRNVMVMRGDGSHVRCTRCLTTWDETQVGLLSAMLAANRQHGTLPETVARCELRECTRYGEHEWHADHRGRTWPSGTEAPWVPAATLQPLGLP